MTRFETGWIRLYRSAYFGDIGRNINCLGLWIAILSLAHWKDSRIIWKGSQRDIPAGTAVIGLREIAASLGCSKNTILRWLSYLERTGRLRTESGTRGTLVTILNWHTYQGEEQEERDTDGTDAGPQVGHERVHDGPLIEEVKKEERKYIPNFETALAEYQQLPGVQKGAKAEKRFFEQVKTQEGLAQLVSAIRNYRSFLSWEENSWRKPKTSFETFLGSKSSGFFWREYIALPKRGDSRTSQRPTLDFGGPDE